MSDFRSSHQRNGRYDHGPMREDHKDDYTVELCKGWLNSYIGLPVLGASLMGISYLAKETIGQVFQMTFRSGNYVSKETIIAYYALFCAAPLAIGAMALYKGMINVVNNAFGHKENEPPKNQPPSHYNHG